MQAEDCVIFWNITTGEKQAKTVKNLISIASCTDFCLLVARLEEDPKQVSLRVYIYMSMKKKKKRQQELELISQN